MHHTTNASQSQDVIQINSQIDAFFKSFSIGTLMDRAGIRKRHGYHVCSLIKTIFTLPFIGKNFFRGIVINKDVDFGKDAAYQVLKCSRYNWRKLVLTLAVKLHGFYDRLTSEDRQGVLIIDDSTYDRSRSKLVELLCRVKDHSTGRYLTGFRMLTMCWSDGGSCLPVDFALLSSSNEKSRIQDIRKNLDKRSCGYRRRLEAMEKSTAHLETMVKRALTAGIKAKYVLMDSWFGMPATITKLASHLDVICMVKKTPKVHYHYGNKRMDLIKIYKRVKKRRGRAKIKASVEVALTDGTPAKLVFVRDSRKSDWLALLSTDISLDDEKIVQTYGKRWDIEVFFKMTKQHLKLAKEIHSRDYDALIAHTSIVFMRYMFLSYQQRTSNDHRTYGELFYACCDEIKDISFMEALYRLLTLALASIRKMGTLCEKTAQSFFDAIIDAALDCVNMSKNKIETV
jgi:hypothetical protein